MRLTSRPAWQALAAHHVRAGQVHLRELFATDASRGERLAIEAASIYLDYSKNRVTDETLKLLEALASECGLRERGAAMFRGAALNTTEKPTPTALIWSRRHAILTPPRPSRP
jgi:glucose-6-phosphate isomerase